MTARDLILALIRRWYVVAVGGALSLAVVYVTSQQEPTYWTQYNIVLVGPAGEDRPNYLDDPVYSLQPLIGVLATRLNDGHPPLLTGDVSATMVGQGRHDGVQIRTPNLGTQWRPLFSANYLDVQVAGPTPEDVSTEAEGTNSEVAAMLDAAQDDLGVPSNLRAEAVPSSAEPVVYAVTGSRPRAAAATGLVGATLTVALVYWLELWRPRRRTAVAPREEA